jgi:hypothetical protein
VTLRQNPDLTGLVSGRLKVTARHSPPGARRSLWFALCECGAMAVVQGSHLVRGRVQSCGCLSRELSRARKLRHGDARRGAVSVEFRAWQKLIARCEDPKDPRYSRYGGRGITVCDRWRTSFEAFLADLGRRPTAGHSVDRKDNDGNYEPGNVRWATREEQARNTTRTRLIEHGGEVLCLDDWATRTGMAALTIARRLNAGWPVALALETPPLATWDRRKGARHAPSRAALATVNPATGGAS